MAFLADDLLEGREAGTRGYDLAAHYVAMQLQGLGARPGNNGSWYQPVPLGRVRNSNGGVSIGARRFADRQDLLYLPMISQSFGFEASVMFAGEGMIDSAANRDDLAGLDISGKILVIIEKKGQEPSPAIMAAAHRGALGVIIIRLPQGESAAPGSISQLSELMGSAVKLDVPEIDGAPPTGPLGALRFIALADRPMLEALFEAAGRPLARFERDLRAGRAVRGFALGSLRADRTIEVDHFSSLNVVAIIPGSDAALAGEYVLLSAHLDGLGIVPRPAATANSPDATDRIRNGAMDNATGIATLLEVARKFMEPGNQPRRAIILAGVTAEEAGLLGSQYLARNPITQGQIVANVNVDMPVLTYAFRDLVAFGGEHSSLGPLVERAARAMNVTIIPDPIPAEGLFSRSDNFSFVQAGVPAVSLMPGFGGDGEQQFHGFLATRYHQPSDDLSQPFNWQSGARFSELSYRIAREIANEDRAPRWYSGTPFTPQGAQTAQRPAN